MFEKFGKKSSDVMGLKNLFLKKMIITLKNQTIDEIYVTQNKLKIVRHVLIQLVGMTLYQEASVMYFAIIADI